MKRTLTILAAVIAISTANNACADIVIDFSESGGNVVANLSGSFNLSATDGLVGQSSNVNFIVPLGGNVAFGGGTQTDYYGVDAAWTPHGTGAGGQWDTASGDNIALYSGLFLGLPVGYTSGSSLSGTATEFGSTFASLTMTPGTYVTTLTNGNFSDTVTVNVGAAIPEPGSAMLLAVGLGCVCMFRKRRLRGAAR